MNDRSDATTDYRGWFRQALDQGPVALSDAGAARRAAMRDALAGAVFARRRRRQAARFVVSSVTLIALTSLSWLLAPGSTGEPLRAPMALRHVEFHTIVNRSDVLTRYTAPSTKVRPGTLIDDDGLLQLLAAADRPTGLIRVEGKVILTAKVTDAIGD